MYPLLQVKKIINESKHFLLRLSEKSNEGINAVLGKSLTKMEEIILEGEYNAQASLKTSHQI